MLNITSKNIFNVAGNYPRNRANVTALVPFFNKYLSQYDINSPYRLKHFFGQACEECAAFSELTEEASGNEYEGRRDLGNVNKGDGARYKGRGIFQLTGRNNYEMIGKQIGIDLVNDPLKAATPEISVITACVYWNTHNLSALADSNLSFEATLEAITRKINGGLNGLDVRRSYTLKAAVEFAIVPTLPDPKPVITVNTSNNLVDLTPLVTAVANNTSATANSPDLVERVLSWIRGVDV